MPRALLRHRRARVTVAVAALLLPAAVLTGCGSSSGGSGSTSSAASPTASTATSSATGESVTVDGVTVSGAPGAVPTIAVAKDAPTPSALVTKDLDEGTGAEAQPGDTITAQYVGVGLQTGQVFDSSWQRGTPLQFPLGSVIKGWQEGIPGMKVGGRRLLIIPAADAYGATPPPGTGIQPDEPLVFVVDLVSIP